MNFWILKKWEIDRVRWGLLILEHEIVGKQELEASYVLDRKVIEETDYTGTQPNKECQSPFENNVLEYLDLLSWSPVLLERLILDNPTKISCIFYITWKKKDSQHSSMLEIQNYFRWPIINKRKNYDNMKIQDFPSFSIVHGSIFSFYSDFPGFSGQSNNGFALQLQPQNT